MKPSSAARAADPAPVLLRENVGPIAVLTLNRPQVRNTLTEAMLAALGEELASLAADNRIRAVVLTAKGPAFSGGHDLKELTARRRDPDGGRAYFEHIMAVCSAMMMQIIRLPQPVIAAVQGTATAAGCQLVASCDLAVTSAKRNSVCRASMPDYSARRRWRRSRVTSRASMRWRCCSPAT